MQKKQLETKYHFSWLWADMDDTLKMRACCSTRVFILLGASVSLQTITRKTTARLISLIQYRLN